MNIKKLKSKIYKGVYALRTADWGDAKTNVKNIFFSFCSTLFFVFIIFAIISIVSPITAQAQEGGYVFNSNSDIIPEERGRIIKKELLLRPNIMTEYYIRREARNNNTLFVIFHGAQNGAVDFMRNTSLHNEIIKKKMDFILFSSYGDLNFNQNKEENNVIVNRVLSLLHRYYRNIVFMGYAEGGTYATNYYCNLENESMKSNINFIWNINGTVPLDCNITNSVYYNLFYGSEMTLNEYNENIYFTEYEGVVNSLLNKGECEISNYSIINGRRQHNVYLEQANIYCREENKVNIFLAQNMERNFPKTNQLGLEGFNGDELQSFELIDFIIKTNYL